MSACVHAFCTRDHSVEPESDLHEGRLFEVDGVNGHPNFDPPAIVSQLSYRDGDREPLLYLGAQYVELTTGGLTGLIAQLAAHLDTMRAVQPTALAVTR
jgi:hypothetical protein